MSRGCEKAQQAAVMINVAFVLLLIANCAGVLIGIGVMAKLSSELGWIIIGSCALGILFIWTLKLVLLAVCEMGENINSIRVHLSENSSALHPMLKGKSDNDSGTHPLLRMDKEAERRTNTSLSPQIERTWECSSCGTINPSSITKCKSCGIRMI